MRGAGLGRATAPAEPTGGRRHWRERQLAALSASEVQQRRFQAQAQASNERVLSGQAEAAGPISEAEREWLNGEMSKEVDVAERLAAAESAAEMVAAKLVAKGTGPAADPTGEQEAWLERQMSASDEQQRWFERQAKAARLLGSPADGPAKAAPASVRFSDRKSTRLNSSH